MAKPQDKNSSTEPTNSADDFDWSKFAGEGVSIDDLAEARGLTPIYAAEKAYEGKWDPVTGYGIDVLLLDMVEGEDARPFILLETDRPTKSVTGNRLTGHKEIDVRAGELVLVPLSGNLQSNRDLILAIKNANKMTWMGFRVTGKQQVNKQPSAMWTFQVMLNKKKQRVREGAYLLASAVPAQLPGSSVPSDGTVIGPNGQPVRSIVGNAQA